MGVVLSPEGADEEYRPLSVCSEEVRREGGGWEELTSAITLYVLFSHFLIWRHYYKPHPDHTPSHPPAMLLRRGGVSN